MKKLMIASLAGVLVAPAALGQEFWSEASQGDLSGNRLQPTAFTLGAGVQSLLGVTGVGDLDYFSITLAPGLRLTQVILVSYFGEDGVAFIAVQNGIVCTELPQSPNVGNLLGWAHFGPLAGNVGQDILDDIGGGAGAVCFTPPLPAATYTFWVQQLGDEVTYQMDFVIEHVPVVCYANCDNSTTSPLLNINDFSCFLNAYAAGNSSANCDGSSVPPTLNINDFSCFLNMYAQGCGE